MEQAVKRDTWLDDLLWLIFPEFCAACTKQLKVGDKCICTHCRLHLPKTNFHIEKDNKVAQLLWGKVHVEHASSYYHFARGGKIQHLIHQFKYKGRKEIGTFIGELYGCELKDNSVFSGIDIIVPVPLHKSKLRKRGYNQSEYFAQGLGNVLNIPVELKAVKRLKANITQTGIQDDYKRFLNTQQIFNVVSAEKLTGKHILLVDDVITTGSTVSACADAILSIPGTKLSVATIAYA